MDENNQKNDVQKNDVKQNEQGTNSSESKKKIITFSIVGGIALIVVMLVIGLICTFTGKPSKSESEKLVKKYLQAATDDDAEEFVDVIDTEGYIIYKEEGVKKFDKKYKDKKKYLKKYYEENNIDGLSDAKDAVGKIFEDKYYTYYSSKEYTLKEIVSVEKLNSSKKLKVIKAKVKVKYSSTTDTQTMKFYVMKVSGKYKIVAVE